MTIKKKGGEGGEEGISFRSLGFVGPLGLSLDHDIVRTRGIEFEELG